MRSISAFARSLLPFLGSLDQGQGISQLNDSLQATIDVTNFVGFGKRRFVSGQNLNVATLQVGGPTAVAGAAQETWRLLWFAARLTTNGTGTITGAHLDFFSLGAANAMPLTQALTLPINSDATIVCPLPEGLIIGPQDLLRISNSGFANDVTWRWGFLYDVLSPAS